MIIASIDIGTNTVLLLIASIDPQTKKILPLLNEYRMPRIGRDLDVKRNISSEKIESLIEVLTEYKLIIDNYSADKVLVTATNAFRIAGNSEMIKDRIKHLFRWDVNVISGETEALYAFLGVIPQTHINSTCLVIDIGGGSTEIVAGNDRKIFFRKSFPFGSVSISEKYLNHFPITSNDVSEIKALLTNTMFEITEITAPDISFAIAGTPTTLACIINDLTEYDDSIVEGAVLLKDNVEKLCSLFCKLTPVQIKKRYSKVMLGREDIILAGSLILLNIMKLLRLEKVIVSSKGIRYGAIAYQLNKLDKI